MIVHGGRSEVYGGFSDVWVFDVAAAAAGAPAWTPLPPATGVAPVPRDHHGAALWADRLFIFGGRFGGCGR